MNVENNLAVIIPAYKSAFLKKTLFALSLQTDKRFNLYIGNDDGDPEIDNIIDGFKEKLALKYVRFTNNLGSKSLSRQWQRCLDMIGDEEWLWIMPDDDCPDPECVSVFYNNLHKSSFDVFRFNVRYINEKDEVFKENEDLLPVQSSFEALIEKLSFKRSGSVAEYIFSREKFNEIGGFSNIPLAWGTDDLLWFQAGFEKGIYGTNEALVSLRQSKLNISGDYSILASIKIKANFIFFKQLIDTKEFKRLNDKIKYDTNFKQVIINHIMYNLQDFGMTLSVNSMIQFSFLGNKIWGDGILKNIRRFYLNNKRVKKHE